MNTYIYIVAMLFYASYSIASPEKKSHAAELATIFFGPEGMNLGQDALQKAETVLLLLSTTNDYANKQAIGSVLEKLREKFAALQAEETHQQKGSQPVARELYHKLFITEERIKHLTALQKQLEAAPYIPMMYEKITNTITSWWLREDRAQDLADALLAFMQMEEDLILHDYSTITAYSVMLQQHTLPKILSPWHDKEVQHILRVRASRLDNARVQMAAAEKIGGVVKGIFSAEAAAGFYVQGVAMFGGSVALQMSDAVSAQEMVKLGNQMTTMQTDLSHTFSLMQETQMKNFYSLMATFTSRQKQISAESGQEGKLFQKELAYLNRSVARFALGTQLLNPDLIALDRMFQASPLLTPKNTVWYNPFFQSVYWQNEDKTVRQLGDWNYSPQDNRFWQQSIVQFTQPQKTPDPSFNSIFTEYIPPTTDAYTLEVDCTLVQTSYPFFAGVMFNKSRWISGNPECLSQYRLIGLYGTQEKADDTKTRTIKLCFAQQKLIIPLDPSKKSEIIAPLEQIMSDNSTVICALGDQALTKDDAQNIERNPQTYTIQVTTKADSVTWRLLKKTEKESVLVKEGTLTNLAYRLNPDAPQNAQAFYQQKQYTLFNYHGIGFMAPGCQAAFSLIKPEAIVYTKEQRDAFTQEQNKNRGV